MFTPKRLLLFIFAMCGFCGTTAAQDSFTWQNQSLGGGFCLEVRFNPYNWDRPLGNPRLYLASDVSGAYRSADLGDTWEMFKNYSDGIDEAMIPSRYATSIAFNNDLLLVYMATNEGIFPRYSTARTGSRITCPRAIRSSINFNAAWTTRMENIRGSVLYANIP